MNKLHVYTGDGKGKTCTAMGLALRSLGHGNTVLICQFMKKGNSGELNALRLLENVHIFLPPAIPCFTFEMTPEEKAETFRLQSNFAAQIPDMIDRYTPNTIILDELGEALYLETVDISVAKHLISHSLIFGETIITGRNIPDFLKEQADYLSLITNVRHPYQTEKLPAREGVEW